MSDRRRIAAFVVATFALSAPFYARIIAAGKMQALSVFGLMWCPAAAAVGVRLFTQRNLRGAGWPWGPMRWPMFAYVIPLGLGLAVYGVVWLTGIGGLDVASLRIRPSASAAPLSPGAAVVFLATVGFALSFVFALGEEIGWRGFLVPELARVTTFGGTVATSGVVWALYHYPLILFADYNSPAPKWFGVLVFTWSVVAMSCALAWLRLKSGSLWTAAVFHGSHNLFVQQVFDRVTVDRGWTAYVTTEFGLGLMAAYTVTAVYFWRRRGELALRHRAAA